VSGEAKCAFDRCQAGGAILPGAPRMSELVIMDLRTLNVEGVAEYHPGCWAAELYRTGAST